MLHQCYTDACFPFALMPTKKRRINITPSGKLYIILQQLAKQDDVPVSTKALELLTRAVDMDEIEDAYFSKLADSLYKKNKGFISHEAFWSKVL